MTLGKCADQQVEVLDVLAVDLLDRRHRCRVVGEVVEGSDRFETELAPELVIARDPAFSGPEDVDSAHVEQRVTWDAQVLHERGVVVEH